MPRIPRPRLTRPRIRRPRKSSAPRTGSAPTGLSPLARHRLEQSAIAGVAALAGAIIAVAIYAATDDDTTAVAPAPEIVTEPAPADLEVPDTAEQLGFPGFATRNTTRISGSDPTIDAAGAALAAFPTGAGVKGPPAVTLVSAADWTNAIAAAPLVAQPIAAPMLLGEAGELPEFSADAIAALGPRGSRRTRGAQVLAVGDVDVPDGLETRRVQGENPAEVAAAAAALRRKLAGPANNMIIASSDEPGFALPAAAWSARSGDPVLFVQREEIPRATARALRADRRASIFLLGPESVISPAVAKELRQGGRRVRRVAGADPVANSIAFARYSDGGFGWDINDPGHGMAIAHADRPLDAAAAASVTSRGKPGPLLVTDDGTSVPPALRGFLLDTKPGYFDDPARAVYNHIWLLGDAEALSIGFQVQVDELTNLERVQAGSGSGLGD